MTTAAEREALEQLAADQEAGLAEIGRLATRPTAAARTARSGAQAASAYVVMDAAQAFDWFGTAHWSEGQVKAGMALAFLVIAALQNLGPKAPGAFLAAVAWVRHLPSSTR